LEQGTRTGVTILIDRQGRSRTTNFWTFADRSDGSRSYAKSLAFAVEELGWIHLTLARELLSIAFCPGSASRLALIGAFYAISESPARHFVLIHDGISEICTNRTAAMHRIEALLDRARRSL
jgi:hypothetical protein